MSKNYAGRKWLYEASYITDETRAEVEKLVAEARSHGLPRVGVRPGSYLGAHSPLAVVTYNGGGSAYGRVFQASEVASA